MPEDRKVPESFKAYEEGKHRRYNLLFAVNGGAFAVAKLFTGKDVVAVLGGLTLRDLSYGMLLFTVVMVADIFLFGEKMRTAYLIDVFRLPGKLVLLSIGFLLCAGWFLAGS